MDLKLYNSLLGEIKNRVRTAQIKATLSANAEMIMMYWDIGKLIYEQQQLGGSFAKVIPQLARDLKNELPKIKGFSERNLSRMLAFYREYSYFPILPQAVAKLENEHIILKIPWGHNILLLEKIKDIETRFWYMHQTIQEGWSREVLTSMLKSNTFQRQGSATTNFEKTLPDSQSELVR